MLLPKIFHNCIALRTKISFKFHNPTSFSRAFCSSGTAKQLLKNHIVTTYLRKTGKLDKLLENPRISHNFSICLKRQLFVTVSSFSSKRCLQISNFYDKIILVQIYPLIFGRYISRMRKLCPKCFNIPQATEDSLKVLCKQRCVLTYAIFLF